MRGGGWTGGVKTVKTGMRVSRTAHWLHLLCCAALFLSSWYCIGAAAYYVYPRFHFALHACIGVQAVFQMPTNVSHGVWRWPYHYPYDEPLEALSKMFLFGVGTFLLLGMNLLVHVATPPQELCTHGVFCLTLICSLIFWIPRLVSRISMDDDGDEKKLK